MTDSPTGALSEREAALDEFVKRFGGTYDGDELHVSLNTDELCEIVTALASRSTEPGGEAVAFVHSDHQGNRSIRWLSGVPSFDIPSGSKLFLASTPPPISASKEAAPAVKPEPYAYAVYIPAEQRIELVHDLEDLMDELTNCECEVTELYDHPAAKETAGAFKTVPRESTQKMEKAGVRAGAKSTFAASLIYAVMVEAAPPLTSPAPAQAPRPLTLEENQVMREAIMDSAELVADGRLASEPSSAVKADKK